MRRPRSCAGFTLLELIVVLGLMGVATTMGTVMMFKISDNWRITTIRAELNSRADAVFSEMRQDFSEIVSARLAGVTLRGTSQSADDKRFYRIPLESDEVIIPVEIAVGPDDRVQRADVRYFIDRKESTPSLMRTTSLPGNPTASTTVKVADGAVAMSIEYAGKNPKSGWQREWLKPMAPSAVRVSVTLADPDRPYEQIARKAVFPIKVD